MSSNYRDETSVDELRANTAYVVLAAVVGAWLFWDAAVLRLALYAPSADYWEHSAVLTEWLRNFPNPINPHVDDPSQSARYMPWFMVLTYFGLIFEFNAVELLSIAAALNYVLIVIGLFWFMRAYFAANWAPLIGFIAIFFCWGVSWNWSNLYHLRSFFYVAGYPSTFVFALSLFAFILVLKILRREGDVLLHGVALGALSALMFLSHPLTGVYAIIGCGLLAITQPSPAFGLRVYAAVMLAVGAVLAEVWPYFSVWKVSLGLYGTGAEQWFAADTVAMTPLERFSSGIWQHIFYNPRLVLTILGPTLLGVPIVLWLLIKRQQWFIVLGTISMAVPYLLHPFVEVPLAHRFLLFVVIYLQLAIVWAVLQVIEFAASRPRPAHAGKALAAVVCVMLVLVGFNVWLMTLEFSGRTLSPKTLTIKDKHGRLPDGLNVVELYTKLTQPLPDDAVVLATPYHGWPLPTVKGKVVSLYHENPLLLDQQERYVATVDFFERPLSAGQRTSILQRYKPGYVLVEGAPVTPGLKDWLAVNAQLVSGVGDFRMYRLLAGATEAEPEPYFRAQEGETAAEEAVSGKIAPDEALSEEVLPEEVLPEEALPQDTAGAGSEPAAQEAADSTGPAGEPAGADPVADEVAAETVPADDGVLPDDAVAAADAAEVEAQPDGALTTAPDAAEDAEQVPEPGEIVIQAPPNTEPGEESPAFGAPIQEPVLNR